MLLRRTLITLGALAQIALAAVAQTPPMGWNSYDCFISSVTEANVRANADYMAQNLKQHGWEYVVIDYCWYHPEDRGGHNPGQDNNMNPRLAMDDNGRLLPDPAKFPSSANGQGFKPLADYVHSLGLKFGIHLMRGVPRQAVYFNSPVLGTSVTANQIANTSSTCGWINTCYGLDMNKTGAQEYLNSCFDLYAQWGVDFVKVDDISSPYYGPEIEGYRNAITNSGREMVFSLSPGSTPLDRASHVKQYGNMWRIIGDLWDNWDQVRSNFDNFYNWSQHADPGHWPDGDMLPLGRLDVLGGSRMSGLSNDEERTVMSMWSITRGPLMFGGNLPDNDAWTLSLLNNDEVLGVNQNSDGNRRILSRSGHIGWFANETGTLNYYLALFNTNSGAQDVTVSFSEMGLPAGESRKFRDLWAKQDLGLSVDQFTVSVPGHGSRLFKVLPGVDDNTPPSVPSGVTAEATGVTSALVQWGESSDAESGIRNYNVYRDGTKIGEASGTSYTDANLSGATTYGYEVSAVNGLLLESTRSATANVTTPADTDPPGIAGVSALGSGAQVTVLFDEPVEETGAEDPGNYGIDNGITITSATLDTDNTTVVLTTTQLVKDITYTLTVNNVRDRAGGTPNTIPANTTATFNYFAGITRIRFYPRDGYTNRIPGGVFEGTNGAPDTGPYTEIFTISSEPLDGQWTETTNLQNSEQGFRYVRYRAPSASFGNIAEIEFYRGTEKVSGPLFGTAGSWGSSGNDYTKAFDGNVSTYWDYTQSDGAYAGMDLSGGATAKAPLRRGSGRESSNLVVRVRNQYIEISTRVRAPYFVEVLTPNGQAVAALHGDGSTIHRVPFPGPGIYMLRTRGSSAVHVERIIAR